MSAGRTARRRNPAGIDTEPRGIRPHPADAGLCIGHAVRRADLLTATHAVIRRDRHETELRVVAALTFELRGRAALPAAAEEEHDRRCRLVRGVPRRFEDPDLQVGIANMAVDLLARAVQFRRIGKSAARLLRLLRGGDKCERGGADDQQVSDGVHECSIGRGRGFPRIGNGNDLIGGAPRWTLVALAVRRTS